MTVGFLLGFCFFTIVIAMYRENKFSKGNDSNVKNDREGKNSGFLLSQDSSNNNLVNTTFNFSPDQIKELDFNFIKLVDYLKIKDQAAINKLFEELYKAEPEERLAIFYKYEQNIGQVDDFLWVKEGMQAFKNLFIDVFLILKFTCSDWIYFSGGWIAENVIRGKKNIND
jgi:hypothetical protein